MSDPDTTPEKDLPQGDATGRATPINAAQVEADPADLWEQTLPVADEDDDYEHPTTPINAAQVEADPADLWEQTLPVAQEDDDYDHPT